MSQLATHLRYAHRAFFLEGADQDDLDRLHALKHRECDVDHERRDTAVTAAQFAATLPPGTPWRTTTVSGQLVRHGAATPEQVTRGDLALGLGLDPDADEVEVHNLGEVADLDVVLVAGVAKPGTYVGVPRRLLDRLLALLPVEHHEHGDGTTLVFPAVEGVRPGVRCRPVHVPSMYPVPARHALAEEDWPVALRHAADDLRRVVGEA